MEHWNTNGASHVWVKVPSFNADAMVWALWGNTNQATAPSYTSNGSTWSENFLAVWHLGTNNTFGDSTASGLNGSNFGTTPTNGAVDGGRFFVDDTPTNGNSVQGGPGLNISNRSFTVSAWQRRTSSGGFVGYGYVFSQGTNNTDMGLHFGWKGDPDPDKFQFNFWGDDFETASTYTDTTTNHFWVGTFDAGTLGRVLYHDGVRVANNTAGAVYQGTPADRWLIGDRFDGGFAGYDGMIDEVRVESAARSSNWVWAVYQNIATNSGFNCYGRALGPISVTNYAVYGYASQQVYDSQVTAGTYSVSMHFRSTNGIVTNATLPNVDVLNNANVQIITNRTFTSLAFQDSGRTVVASNSSMPAVAGANVDVGAYILRWSATDSNGVTVSDATYAGRGSNSLFSGGGQWVSVVKYSSANITNLVLAETLLNTDIGKTGEFAHAIGVINYNDDGYFRDETYPFPGSSSTNITGAGENFAMRATGKINLLASGAVTFGTLSDDGVRLRVDGGTVLEIDGLVGGLTVFGTTNLTAGSHSVELTFAQGPVNAHVELFVARELGTWTNFTPGAGSPPSGWELLRPALSFNVADDDIVGPTLTNFVLRGAIGISTLVVSEVQNGGWSLTGRVQDATSGVNVNGNTTSDSLNNVSPYFAIYNNTGTVIITQAFTNRPADGGAIVTTNLGMETVTNTVPLASIPVGIYTALLVAADNDEDRTNASERAMTTNVYVFQVVADRPGLAVGPTSLVFTTTLGDASPASQTFNATNVGVGVLYYTNYQTYGTTSGWLTVAPSTGVLNTAASRVHTAAVDSLSILGAGTYFATNRVDGNQTNAAQNVVVMLVISNIASPTSVTVSNDGNELVRLNWNDPASRSNLIVWRSGAAPSSDPTNSGVYAVGDNVGGGTVIYKGNTAGTEFNHVVATNSTNYYRFYTINNNRYSPAVEAATTTRTYDAVIYEQFAYTNGVGTRGLAGGNMWTNAWTNNSAVNVLIETNAGHATKPQFPQMPTYPSNAANRIVLSNGVNDAEITARRHFLPFTTGDIFVAAQMAVRNGGDGKYTGIRLLSNNTEKIYFGEVGNPTNKFGVDGPVGLTTSTFDLNPIAGGDTGNTYLIIARFNFASNNLKAKAFYRTTTVPAAEPTGWDVDKSVTAGLVNQVNGIELVSGGFNGQNPGYAIFDEIRVAYSWESLVNVVLPYATNYQVGATNQIADGQVTSGTYNVIMDFYSSAQMATNSVVPNIDIFGSTGSMLMTNLLFTNNEFFAGNTVLRSSNSQMSAINSNSVTLGSYTLRWSAVNAAGTTNNNQSTLSNGQATVFTVVDDDTNFPARGSNIGTNASGDQITNSSMIITIGGTKLTNTAGAAANNKRFDATDGQLASVSAGSPFRVIVNGYDLDSGLSRGTNDNTRESNMDITNIQVNTTIFTRDNVSNYFDADSSSFAATFQTNATNVWRWDGFGTTEIDALFTDASNSNRINVTWFDADFDRGTDTLVLVNEQYGFLRVTDDDAAAPTVENGIRTTNGGSVARELQVSLGSNNLTQTGSGTNRYYTINDAQLVGVNPTNELSFWFGVRDALSGVRSTNVGAAATNSNFDLDLVIVDNVTNYDPAKSSPFARTLSADATNVWTWTNAFSATEIETLYTNVTDTTQGLNRLSLTLKDADLDRSNDQSTLTNQQYGYLVVSDDDTNTPQVVLISHTNAGTSRLLHVSIGGTRLPANSAASNALVYAASDGDLAGVTAGNDLRFWFGARDDSGLSRGGVGNTTNMNIDFGNIISDDTTNFNAAESSTLAETTNARPTNIWKYVSAFTGDEIQNLFTNVTDTTQGLNRVTVTLHDNDNDRANDRLSLINFQYGFVIVTDDDTTAPVFDSALRGASNAAMDFLIGPAGAQTSRYISGTSTSGLFSVTDQDLASVAATNPMWFVFNVYDPQSGIYRGTVGLTNLNYDIVGTNDNFQNYSSAYSSADTTLTNGTSVYYHATAFSAADIETLFGRVTNPVTVSAHNADYDRGTNDLEKFVNFQAGSLVVSDDDTNAPELSSFMVSGTEGASTVTVTEVAGGGWSITGLVRDLLSGINSNAAVTTLPNISPYFTVKNSTGTTIIVAEVFAQKPADGGALAFSPLAQPSVTTQVAVASAPLGVYTAYVTVADNDKDRTLDRSILTNFPVATFTVIQGPTPRP